MSNGLDEIIVDANADEVTILDRENVEILATCPESRNNNNVESSYASERRRGSTSSIIVEENDFSKGIAEKSDRNFGENSNSTSFAADAISRADSMASCVNSGVGSSPVLHHLLHSQRVAINPPTYADASARQNMTYFQSRPLVKPINGNVPVPIFTNGIQMPPTFGSVNAHQHYLPIMPQNLQRGSIIRQYDSLSMTATNGLIVPCQSTPFTQTIKAQLGPPPKNISDVCNKAKIAAADKHKQYMVEALSFADHIPFKPEPITEWAENFPIPQNSYPCKDCGDIYNTETCLQFHRQRRSMYITVRCILCRSDLTFYNKCTYHGHVNYHKENVGKMGRQNIDEASIFAEISAKSIDWSEVKLWFEDTAFKRLSDPEAFLKYEVDLAEKTVSQKLQCSECSTSFENHDTLKLHITHNEPQQRKQFICPACQAVYFSRCGFTAHQRYAHPVVSLENGVRSSSFTCPECGLRLDAVEKLQGHLIRHMNDPTTFSSYRCPECFTFYSSFDTLVSHVVSSHLGVRSSSSEKTVKCCFCQSLVAQTKEAAVEHSRQHLTRVQPFKLYRCALCGRLMENENGLWNHVKNTHPTVVNAIKTIDETTPCSNIILTPSSNSDRKSSFPFKPAASLSCLSRISSLTISKTRRKPPQAVINKVSAPPNVTLSENEKNFRTKVLAETSPSTSNISFACRKCGRAFISVKDRFEHGRADHLLFGHYVCLLCDNLPFDDSKSLINHFDGHIDQSKEVLFICDSNHCSESFVDNQNALIHLENLHNLKPADQNLDRTSNDNVTQVTKAKKRSAIESACDLLAKKAFEKLINT